MDLTVKLKSLLDAIASLNWGKLAYIINLIEDAKA